MGDTRILIDAGISMRAIDTELKKAGSALADIDAIFITHEHSDHVRGLPIITKHSGIPVHVNTLSAPYVKCEEKNIVRHSDVFECSVGDFDVTAFHTPHDSNGSVGYIIKTYGHTLGIATDLGHMPYYITQLLAGCDDVILESNHDISLLENGPYPIYLKERIMSDYGHLSNDVCAECAAEIASNGVKAILLAHLSDENNRPQIALNRVAAELARKRITKTAVKTANKNILTKLC
jgi:phosphoribosyl 1,2-cyclic phosphodiesterase